MPCSIANISSVSGLGKYPDSCAAILAGLAAARGSPNFELFFQGDEEPRPIPISVAPVVTHGFRAIGRLVALLNESLVGLLKQVPDHREVLNVPWFLALPDPWERQIDTGDLDGAERPPVRLEWLASSVLQRSFEAAGVQRVPQCRCYGGDPTTFVDALRDAVTGLEQGAFKRCVLGAVDSLVSPEILDALAADNLLRTPANQYGFSPGEGAILIVLEAAAGAGARPHLRAATRSPKSGGTRERGDGRALAKTMLDTYNAASLGSRFALITDQNGERERAIEWGDALVHLTESGLGDKIAATITHAMNLGETGVASPAFGMSLAVHALARRREMPDVLLTVSSFGPPACAAFVIARG